MTLLTLNDNIAICGDSFSLLKQIPKESVQLILTDPPYNISKPNSFKTMKNHCVGTDFGPWDYNFDLVGWIEDAVNTLKPGGSIVTFMGYRKIGLIGDKLESLGLDVKSPVLLLKTNPVPRNRDRRFLATAEFALWAVKPGKWIFNRGKEKKFETGVYYAPTQKSFHPTKKPQHMFDDLVSILSNEGDYVLDPFAGSGTTAISCQKQNRKYIIFENDENYFNESIKAINEANRCNSVRG